MPNKDIIRIREEVEAQAIKDMQGMLLAYKRSLDEVQKHINQIHAQYLLDGELTVSRQQRYSVLRELERLLIEEAQKVGLVEIEETTNILTTVYNESYYQTAFIIDAGIATTLTFSVVQPEFVRAVVNSPIEGKMFSDRIWNNKDILANRVLEEIEKSMIQGKDVRKISRAIKKEFEVSAYEAKRLVVTEQARVSNAAHKSIYEQSSVVNKVMIDATLDSKTSEICRGYDGNIYNANSNYPTPPFHPNCRSVIIPIVNGWSPTKKRENEGDKKIIDYTTYEKWKKSRNVES
ncbi:minor capsid protein [Cytobacillus sp. IB215665]|uniref:minor capsid protein n=1 Tax=Cytobacillus sp. IB215665 TaxID=3097357 RepID=UPI002A144A55|nr:minor capsid protein [Cytobacillus sp. IB215665]MDX8367851.1 minor capsid protein [Cytobacillus sp. IB215665]